MEKVKQLLNEKRSFLGAFREQQLKFNTKEDYDAMEVYLSYNGLMTEIASNIAIEDVEKIYMHIPEQLLRLPSFNS